MLGLTLLTMLFGGVLALDRGDLWYRHVVRRQLKRSQLPSHTDVPGLVFLEIDGLAARRAAARAARRQRARAGPLGARRRLPAAAAGRRDWSSQTGACQAGLLHGDDHDMPAFRWWEKDLGRAIVTNHPQGRGRDRAPPLRTGAGLLHADGASRANILSGDAPHTHADDEHGARPRPPGPARAGLLRLLRQPVRRRAHRAADDRRDRRSSAGRRSSRCAATCARGCTRGWSYALRARVRHRDPARPAGRGGDRRHPRRAAGRSTRRSWPTTRSRTTRAGAAGHAGRAAARRPGDRTIAAAVPHAPRPYRLVVLSDHGQSQGATFQQRYGEALEDIVQRHGGGDVRAEDAHSDEGRASLNAERDASSPTRDTRAGHDGAAPPPASASRSPSRPRRCPRCR